MVDGKWKKLFWSESKKWHKTNENILKIATGQEDYYTTGCLLNYPYFKENSKVIGIDLIKQQALDADPKANQQINFTRNLEGTGNATIFLFTEEVKKNILAFSQGTMRVLWIDFALI